MDRERITRRSFLGGLTVAASGAGDILPLSPSDIEYYVTLNELEQAQMDIRRRHAAWQEKPGATPPVYQGNINRIFEEYYQDPIASIEFKNADLYLDVRNEDVSKAQVLQDESYEVIHRLHDAAADELAIPLIFDRVARLDVIHLRNNWELPVSLRRQITGGISDTICSVGVEPYVNYRTVDTQDLAATLDVLDEAYRKKAPGRYRESIGRLYLVEPEMRDGFELAHGELHGGVAFPTANEGYVVLTENQPWLVGAAVHEAAGHIVFNARHNELETGVMSYNPAADGNGGFNGRTRRHIDNYLNSTVEFDTWIDDEADAVVRAEVHPGKQPVEVAKQDLKEHMYTHLAADSRDVYRIDEETEEREQVFRGGLGLDMRDWETSMNDITLAADAEDGLDHLTARKQFGNGRTIEAEFVIDRYIADLDIRRY